MGEIGFPDGEDEGRRPAWDVMAGGGSYGEAALASGVAAGSVSRWVAAWRRRFGDDLFRSAAQEARRRQTEAARDAMAGEWSELRIREAKNLGVTGSRLRGQILELLPEVGRRRVDRGPDGSGRPVVVNGPSGQEIKALAEAAARLLETAEKLDDRPLGRHIYGVA